MFETNIMDLMDGLETASDAAIENAIVKLGKLRLLTAGSDRELVCWAIGECRELLTPGGRLRRAAALAARQMGPRLPCRPCRPACDETPIMEPEMGAVNAA